MAVLGRALGDFVLAGVLISLSRCAVAFELLWRLASAAARRSGCYTGRSLPCALPDGGFPRRRLHRVALPGSRLGAFFLAERDHWAWAAIAAGGAMLTRSVGVARRRRTRRDGVARVDAFVAPARAGDLRRVPDRRCISRPTTRCVRSRTGPVGPAPLAARPDRGPLGRRSRRSGTGAPVQPVATTFSRISRTSSTSPVFAALLPLVWHASGRPYFRLAALAIAIPVSLPATPGRSAGVLTKGDFPLFSMPRFTLPRVPVLHRPCLCWSASRGQRDHCRR